MECTAAKGYKDKIIGVELGSPCFFLLGKSFDVAFSSLVIPVDQIDGLSDGELVNFVKCGIDFAKFYEVYCTAIHIKNRIQDMAIPEIDKYVDYLMEWQGYDDEKSYAISLIISELLQVRKLILQEQRAKESRQAKISKRRNQFSLRRDRLMIELIERDGYKCANCEATKNLSIDHIIPLSKDGSDELDNLQILCRSCNSRKGDRL